MTNIIPFPASRFDDEQTRREVRRSLARLADSLTDCANQLTAIALACNLDPQDFDTSGTQDFAS